ncbi:MAG: baseplate J/gp47 family protein [Acetobacteraceae bacterium]|nr:baseplate J/gp47 family protein [Acetobacteraceae bacterium]
MQLRLQDFASLVAGAAASVQASSRALVDLSVGSVLRAILEANAALALWLQWLILQVQSMTRAATSEGADLDSWMADFALARLPAVAASGQVRFARFATTEAVVVPVGALVRTTDAQLGFAVTANPAHAAWHADPAGYAMGAGVGSVVVPVAAVAPGSAGNVLPGSITLIADALAGVDTVANDWPTLGGLDAESDAALRVRFRDYLASRSRATPVAVGYAVTSLRQGLQYHVDEAIGTGSFLVVVDDGSGAPPADLLAAAATAIEAVRPVGTSFSVQPPDTLYADVAMTVTVAGGAVHATVAALVAAAVGAHMSKLAIGEAMPWSRLAQLAYSASPAVVNVTDVLLGGDTADVDPGVVGVVRPGNIVVS